MFHAYDKFLEMIVALCKKGEIKDACNRLAMEHSAATMRVLIDLLNSKHEWVAEFEAEMLSRLQPNANGKKRFSNMLGNPLILLRRIAADREVVGRYYYHDSRCWRAIERHIEKSDPCVLIVREPLPLHYTSAHGPCSLKPDGVYVHFDSFMKGLFTIEFTVRYRNTDEDLYEGREGFGKGYHLAVPMELEDDCTDREFDARFDKWLKAKTVEYKKERAATKDVKALKRLIEQNPEEARRILISLNR